MNLARHHIAFWAAICASGMAATLPAAEPAFDVLSAYQQLYRHASVATIFELTGREFAGDLASADDDAARGAMERFDSLHALVQEELQKRSAANPPQTTRTGEPQAEAAPQPPANPVIDPLAAYKQLRQRTNVETIFGLVAHDFVKHLASADDAAAADAIASFDRVQNQVELALVKLADADPPQLLWGGEARFEAVQLLAKYRTPAAIPVLVRRIDTSRVISNYSLFRQYEYANALWSFRRNAVPTIFTHVTATNPAQVSDAAIDLYVLCLIWLDRQSPNDPQNVAQAIALIEEQITLAPANVRENLTRMLTRARLVEKNPLALSRPGQNFKPRKLPP
jgi:hypothetical protein